ncbi:MAG: IS256 family transposase [candidate division Zixibacteria bacterium]|nr:IS256 family transposase [candidate division Zixibacteria bacterium]
MKAIDFSEGKIAGGMEVVKSYGSQGDFWEGLRERVIKRVKTALGRVLAEEVKGVVGCSKYERSEERKGYLNGSYERGLLSEYGWIEGIKVPRVRGISWTPSIWGRHKRRQRVLYKVILEGFLLGHSAATPGFAPRKTKRMFKRVFKGSISAQTVSNVVKLLDQDSEDFRRRRFEDKYRVLILDGLRIKLSLPVVQEKVVLMALGIKEDGTKELSGYQVVSSEKECFWWGFLEDLRDRGLRGDNLEVIVHDGMGGLSSAVAIVYPWVKVQRCVFHKISNLADKLENPFHRFAIMKDASEIYEAETLKELYSRLRAFCLKWQPKEPRKVKNFLRDFEQTLTYREYPEPWRTLIRTTNPLERFLEELQRRIKPMRRFPNQKSAERILYGLIFYALNEQQQDVPSSKQIYTMSLT